MQYLVLAFPRRDGEFTYEFKEKLNNPIGKIMDCTLRNKKLNGVVVRKASARPKFKTIECTLNEIFKNFQISKETLELIKWISEYYFCPFHKVLNLFLPKKYLDIKRPPVEITDKEPIFKPKNNKLFKLTKAQEKAYKEIQKSNKPTLLWGYTGSGKTEIYRHLALKTLQEGKQILILSPEILLTKNIAAQFEEILPGQTGIWHSKTSVAEKKKLWLNIASDNTGIILGARSAVFCPFKNLGLIIMDEEQEWDSYKNDQDPRYQAKRLIMKMAELYNIKVLLGTATPSVETYYLAKKSLIETVKLEERIYTNP